jgi:hypothetical protein
VEAILFTQLGNVRNRYIVGAFYAVVVWILYVFDLRMSRHRQTERTGFAGKRLFEVVLKEQILHARVGMPTVIGFYGVAAVLALTQPGGFIDQNGHFISAALQLGAALIYLVYVLRFYRGTAPLILNYRQEAK